MRKKILVIGALTCLMFLISACSGVKQEDYDAVEENLVTAKAELETSEKDREAQKESYDALKTEYDSYKEKMKPYEEMEASEAEARKVAAEQEKAAAEQAEAEKKAAEEAEAAATKAAEEAKGYETGITFDQLSRTPDDFLAQKVKFTGRVIQVMEGATETQIRMATDGKYDNVIYCAYAKDLTSARVLEDDTITIYGISAGLLSYESTMGGTITLPSILVEKIDQ